jgi:hypothetical protein
MATLADINAKKYLTTSALAIRAANARQSKAIGAELFQQHQQRQDETRELQALLTQIQAMEGAHGVDQKDLAARKAEAEEYRTKFKTEDAEAEARRLDLMNSPAPPATDIINMALEHDVKTKQSDYGYVADLPADGNPRPIVDECRTINATLKAERESVIKVPKPRAEARLAIGAAVANIASKTLMTFKDAARVDYDLDRRKFKDRPVKMPMLALYDGVGQQLRVPDSMGLMALLWPDDITERLVDLATGGKSDEEVGALSMRERVAKLADVEARILANDRRGEWAIRQCQAKGIAAGPRWTNDIRAILDLK